MILVLGAITTLVTAVTQRPKYTATATLLFTGHDASNNLVLGQLDISTLAQSETVSSRAIRELGLNRSVGDFSSNIAARAIYQSNLVSLSFTDPNPAVAVAATNAVAHGVKDYFLEVTRARFDGLSSYLDKAMRKRKEEVAELDRRLYNEVGGNSVLAEDNAATILNARLTELEAARDHTSAELTESEAKVAAATQHLGDIRPLARAQIAGTDYLYRALQSQWANDAATLEAQRSQFTAAYPGLGGLSKKVKGEGNFAQQRLADLSGQPDEDSSTYVGVLGGREYEAALGIGVQAQLSAYDREIDQLHSELRQLPSAGVQLAALRRDRDTARVAYLTLAQHRELMLAEQAQAATTGTVEIIDEAHSAAASGKRGPLLIFGSAFGFLVLAFTVAFLLDSSERRMSGVDAIADVYGKPVVATLRAS